MIITVFRKKITPKNGSKSFNKYVTVLTDKDGNTYYCDVKFRESVTKPQEFPCNVEIDKSHANFTSRKQIVTDSDGNDKEYTRNTLWINEIANITPYIDHSLDNFG